jgi:hypothetical protein
MKFKTENYRPLSNVELSDASEMTRGLLRIVENLAAKALVESNPRNKNKWIRVRTDKPDRPAMQIRAYTSEVPQVRIHLRTFNDHNKAAEFFAAANLDATDWSKRQDEGSHEYIGAVENLLVSAERALRAVLQEL